MCKFPKYDSGCLALRSLSKVFSQAFFSNRGRAWLLTFSIQAYMNYLNSFLIKNRAVKKKPKVGIQKKTNIVKKELFFLVKALGEVPVNLLLLQSTGERLRWVI